jgi:hypothetical protein
MFLGVDLLGHWECIRSASGDIVKQVYEGPVPLFSIFFKGKEAGATW